MNFWILLIYIGLLSNLSNGQTGEKIKILNYSKCSTPARDVTAIPTTVKGQNVGRGYYPWHATISILTEGQSLYICGGSLISTKTVLTAAHCMFLDGKLRVEDTLVIKFNVQNPNVDGTVAFVNRIAPHESYNANNYRHDVALLKLTTTVEFNDFIRPACLTNMNFNIVDVDGYVVGFGLNKEELGKLQLQEVVMQGKSPEDCREKDQQFYDHYVVPEYSFCAGSVNGTTISETDGGSGIVFKHLKTKFVRGIVSVARALPSGQKIDATKYAMFTDIQYHYKWIVKNMDRIEKEDSEEIFLE